MHIFIWVLAGIGLFFTAKYFLLRYEIKRLQKQIDLLRENAEYGKRLYLEEDNAVIANAIKAINHMVDGYERKLKRVGEMEKNIRHSISSISHDLRTPLTSINGYLQLLLKESLPNKQREYLDAIANSTGTLRDLTENFYELSRLDLEKNTLSIQNLNLEHKEYFSVTINNDTAIAVPIEINRVFERFYTTDFSRNDRSMGLGLYTSQKLVESMGGKIVAHQDKTKFNLIIALPRNNS